MDPSVINFLSHTPIFKHVSKDVIQMFLSKLAPIHIKRGDILFRQSDPSDSLYFILSGRIRMTRKQYLEGEKVVNECGRGEVIGDMALIIDQPRIVTAKAITDCELLELDKQTYEQFIDQFPREMFSVAQNAAVNLYQSTARGFKKHHCSSIFCLVPGSRNPAFSSHVRSIVKALDKIAPTLHLHQKKFRSIFNCECSTETLNKLTGEVLLEWRYKAEQKYRYIILETEPTLTAWTKWCLGQAEKIFVVGKAGPHPKLNEIENYLFSDPQNPFANTELVIFHDASARRPHNTCRWFKDRYIHGVNHIKNNNHQDINRLARMITNQCNCLVLGGGGARGIAHAGVIKAFEESGIPIDAIGGTSMGSVIAGLYAKNRCYEKLENDMIDLANAGTLLDYTLPWIAMTKGKRLTKRLKGAFGYNIMTEDLWMKFFAVASNIVKSNIEVLSRGPLWKNVRASTSLPGIFPPIHQGEKGILVDGAVLNSLPVDVMHELVPEGCIIATRVISPNEISNYHPTGPIVSGWSLLCDKLNPWSTKKNIINIASILMDVLTISSTHLENAMSEDANVCIEIDTSAFELLDLKPTKAIIELGYETTMRKLEDENVRKCFY